MLWHGVKIYNPYQIGVFVETQQLTQTSVPAGNTVLISEACAICNVCRRTMYHWIKKGLVRTKSVGVTTRIFTDSLTQERIHLSKSKTGPKPKK